MHPLMPGKTPTRLPCFPAAAPDSAAFISLYFVLTFSVHVADRSDATSGFVLFGYLGLRSGADSHPTAHVLVWKDTACTGKGDLLQRAVSVSLELVLILRSPGPAQTDTGKHLSLL